MALREMIFDMRPKHLSAEYFQPISLLCSPFEQAVRNVTPESIYILQDLQLELQKSREQRILENNSTAEIRFWNALKIALRIDGGETMDGLLTVLEEQEHYEEANILKDFRMGLFNRTGDTMLLPKIEIDHSLYPGNQEVPESETEELEQDIDELVDLIDKLEHSLTLDIEEATQLITNQDLGEIFRRFEQGANFYSEREKWTAYKDIFYAKFLNAISPKEAFVFTQLFLYTSNSADQNKLCTYLLLTADKESGEYTARRNGAEEALSRHGLNYTEVLRDSATSEQLSNTAMIADLLTQITKIKNVVHHITSADRNIKDAILTFLGEYCPTQESYEFFKNVLLMMIPYEYYESRLLLTRDTWLHVVEA